MIREKDRPVVSDDVFLGKPLEMTGLECAADFSALLGRLLNRINELSESVVVLAESVDEANLSLRRMENRDRRSLRAEISTQTKRAAGREWNHFADKVASKVKYMRERTVHDVDKVKEDLWHAMKALNRDHEYNRNKMAEMDHSVKKMVHSVLSKR